MAVMKSLTLFWIWLFVSVFRPAGNEEQRLTAGQDGNLTCRVSNKNPITVVEWSRADLGSKYVLMYRDGHFIQSNQHASFKNRVDLQDRQMKDGDVSLILKNVTINDAGTYECRVVQSGTNRMKRANLKTPPIKIITLVVVAPPGPTGGATEDEEEEEGGKEDGVSRGHPALITAGICVSVMVLLLVVMSVISKTLKKKKSPLSAPADKEVEQQLVCNKALGNICVTADQPEFPASSSSVIQMIKTSAAI